MWENTRRTQPLYCATAESHLLFEHGLTQRNDSSLAADMRKITVGMLRGGVRRRGTSVVYRVSANHLNIEDF
ncbi:hypothetical protein chiPu_0021323 [Chiloscyllium punctatum]|uniref:Uncharacterized protein n=1 Tax=Chiloscyllium punctatum TaxID=137246 RepID=A0A401RQ28_CHIPU|nr:hypothetical protein [Chiloscyllium punctatum]